jgi:hypothetical protein
MAEAEYRTTADGGTLKTLASGLQIIRRQKHEWLPALQSSTPEELRRQTDKIRGSKFVATWTFTRFFEWIETEVDALSWNAATGASEHTSQFEENRWLLKRQTGY